MGPNYKKQDREYILAYLKAHPISSVDAIMEESGAEPVRVYPLLFELNQEKIIRLALQRAESIFPILNDSILKCYLAVFCYGESFDKEKGYLARRMLKELKQNGTKLKAMEELLESMEEFEEEKWLY